MRRKEVGEGYPVGWDPKVNGYRKSLCNKMQ